MGVTVRHESRARVLVTRTAASVASCLIAVMLLPYGPLTSTALATSEQTRLESAPLDGPGHGLDGRTSRALFAGSASATAIATGDNTCAVLAGGTVMCWGSNSNGQLGNGTTTNSPIPVAVSGISTATAIAAGYAHSCAVLAGGMVMCWGTGWGGQLGNGTYADSAIPVAVSGITTATAVAAGDWHACALLGSGTIRCWGAEYEGELGDGTTFAFRNTPVTVSDITTAITIDAGHEYTCALLAAGTVECWGHNGSGQLGNGTTTDSPTPVAVSGITTATAIATGQDGACALLAAGTVDCWGSGIGSNSSVPIPVAGITNATAIAVSGYTDCALLAAGTVDCWGDNSWGQLGNGTTTGSPIPVPVNGITTATAIATSGVDTCALLAGGSVMCWGYNGSGQLGDGTTTNRLTPVGVIGLGGAGTAPTITGITPPNGAWSGGNKATITGTGLSRATVTFGGQSAVVDSAHSSDTTLVVTVPPEAVPTASEKPVKVMVKTTAGSGTLAKGYAYRGLAVVAIGGWASHLAGTSRADKTWPWNYHSDTDLGYAAYLHGGNALGGSKWSANVFVDFSYHQSRPSFGTAYGPCETLGSLRTNAALLDTEIDTYVTTHPDIDIVLIGHSQGGAIAMAYLDYLRVVRGTVNAPTPDSRITGVVSLDSPLGGFGPKISDAAATLSKTMCGGSYPADFADFKAMGHGLGKQWPWGGFASISARISPTTPAANQALATTAGAAGVEVMTIGNMQDWAYEWTYDHSSQWVLDVPAKRVYARVIDKPEACSTDLLCLLNHGAVQSDIWVDAGIELVLRGAAPMDAFGLTVPVHP